MLKGLRTLELSSCAAGTILAIYNKNNTKVFALTRRAPLWIFAATDSSDKARPLGGLHDRGINLPSLAGDFFPSRSGGEKKADWERFSDLEDPDRHNPILGPINFYSYRGCARRYSASVLHRYRVGAPRPRAVCLTMIRPRRVNPTPGPNTIQSLRLSSRRPIGQQVSDPSTRLINRRALAAGQGAGRSTQACVPH